MRVDAAIEGLRAWAASNAAIVVAVAQLGIFLLPIVLGVFALRGQMDATIYGVAAAILAYALGLVLERVLDRPRPFVALGFTPLFAHAPDASACASRQSFDGLHDGLDVGRN